MPHRTLNDTIVDTVMLVFAALIKHRYSKARGISAKPSMRTEGVELADAAGSPTSGGPETCTTVNLRPVEMRDALVANRDAKTQSWPRLSEQIFRLDKWSLCRG
jgi:hypothetical protein